MSLSEKQAAAAARPELVCYAIDADAPAIVPGRGEREWMDLTDQRYAYRCIPLSIANASGWEILSPVAFSATWFGGDRTSDIAITPIGPRARVERIVSSHFGHGVLTFHTGYLFRTSPGWALWCRGTPNSAKRNLIPLEGLVETDWLPFPFTMNWRFTRLGTVRFEEGEPFCFVTPVPHAQLDQIQPVIRPLNDDPQLKTAFQTWSESRNDFNQKLAQFDPKTVAAGWQRHYVRGESHEGKAQGYHLSKRKLKMPKK